MAALVLLVSSLAQSAVAQDAPASTGLMRDQAQALRELDAIAKGDAPFDPPAVASRISILIETSFWLKAAFPIGDRGRMPPDSKYYASEKVWTDRADFEARAQRLVDVVRAAAPKVTSAESLRAVHKQIGEACSDCHKTYRLEK